MRCATVASASSRSSAFSSRRAISAAKSASRRRSSACSACCRARCASSLATSAVTKKTASKYKLKTISDLATVAPRLTFGGPPECQDRDLCLGAKSQQIYGLQFKEFVPVTSGGPHIRTRARVS